MAVESPSDAEADVVVSHIDGRGVARITINRPAVHNAWNPQVVAALTNAIESVSAMPHVRAVVLTGEGKSFSAGGDLRWMRGVIDLSSEQRREDAIRIGRLLVAIELVPQAGYCARQRRGNRRRFWPRLCLRYRRGLY